jgi:tripartite-type tricarboxylate transporter receptor subunit TctC
MFNKERFPMKLKFLFLILLLLCFGVQANTIEAVVSTSIGGPNDMVTRKIIDRIEKQTNLKFVVLNKPGAAKVIAYNYVNNTHKPTLMLETNEIEKHEVFKHLTQIYNLGYFYNILVVSEKSGIRNLNQLLDLSKQREINFGHGGVGSYSHWSSLYMCEKILRCLDVPYKSSADGMLGLLSGTIDAYAIVSYGSKQFLENNKFIAIHNIRFDKEKSWYKLFGKNLSEKDMQVIASVLSSIDDKFFIDMGFER